jgi:hypothetical protein
MWDGVFDRRPTSSTMSDLAQVIPLAAAAAISPVVFLVQFTTLTGPRPAVADQEFRHLLGRHVQPRCPVQRAGVV